MEKSEVRDPAERQRNDLYGGLYRIEHGTDPVFTILTRSPVETIAFIHDRMPVILPAAAMNDWLNIRYDANEGIRAAAQDVEYYPE